MSIILWWKKDTHVQIVIAYHNFIDTMVQFKGHGMPVYITWVYTDTDDRNRSGNWDSIRVIGRRRAGLWVCQGDFNALTHHYEKEAGRSKPQRQIDDFNNFINDMGLEDMGSKGQRFTWGNNRRGEDRVYERLDRLLCNATWATQFPNA